MTQEFKDWNVLEVNGQLLCRHFLSGTCIKGSECCGQCPVEGQPSLIVYLVMFVPVTIFSLSVLPSPLQEPGMLVKHCDAQGSLFRSLSRRMLYEFLSPSLFVSRSVSSPSSL